MVRSEALPEVALIRPDWPAPANVRAASTTRRGGVSTGAWARFNLGHGSGDDPQAVAENRRRLREALGLETEPAWLKQVHGERVVDAAALAGPVAADASLSRTPGRVCAVLTADCLPVLLCDRAGTVVAAAHAGWRGLACGVLRTTVEAMAVAPYQLLAWLGPAIGSEAFEVGPEVRAVFLKQDADHADDFRPGTGDRWLADIYALARRQLATLGVTAVHGGERCTVSEPAWFFSYRRDGAGGGRMASLVWLDPAR
ncbi:MAG: peptidoglycan editing factor PgeF [Candidatus Competibacterales bacterium]|nr:peptidoglycan editing factor PgeF [Candidatus Competibacterales bacterium]